MTTEALQEAFAVTRGILVNVSPADYDKPTPCASWTVRDLVNHIVEGANWFGLCVEAGGAPDPDPTKDVDYAADDLLVAYDQGVEGSLSGFGAPGALEKQLRLPFGEMPAGVFMSIATNDVFTHGWDLARATGQGSDLDGRLAAQLLAGMKLAVSDEMRGADGSGAPFGPERPAPAGASPADQLAAFLGRSV